MRVFANLPLWLIDILLLVTFISQIPILDPRSQIQGSKRHRISDPGSATLDGDFGFALAIGGSVGYWLSTGAAVLTTHSIDQLSEAFMCKKEFSVYFISTQSLNFLLFLSCDVLRICFLTHLAPALKTIPRRILCFFWANEKRFELQW